MRLPGYLEILMRTLTSFILALLAGAAFAGPADEACMTLRSARIQLMALVGTDNPVYFASHRTRVDAASTRLDTLLDEMQQGASANDAARARAFKPVWEAFKQTRETRIIPAVAAGKPELAREIALGIQAERMRQMRESMGCQ
jgi:hypothetical protein